jgi:GST-like protein
VPTYTLFARPGWGSALVEAQFHWYGLEYRTEAVDDLFADEAARERLAKINPLSQIPTLLLPGGAVMTESVAITLHLADVTGDASLVPTPAEACRPEFLRWLIFLAANIYPTFTYADDPARFVTHQAARDGFRDRVERYRERLWGIFEAEAGAPWFLGTHFSALDLFIGVMTRWRPRRAWFAAHTAKLNAIALGVDSEKRLAAVWAKNFPAGTNPA